jgi:anti-sigma regulatory factor (Ser/Thr protein kinase)
VLRPVAASPHRLRFDLVARPNAVRQARRMTRAWLTAWSVCEETCDTAALVASELVTNAIVHTSSQLVVCELTDDVEKLRIAVCDEGCPSGASLCPPAGRDSDEHGRGLLLVAAMCSAWGARELGSGLQVWAELPRRADRHTGIEADTVRRTGAEWVS